MHILVLITGEYGQRHVDNMQQYAPANWHIETWTTPKTLPPVIDYPEEHLPKSLPPADLILSLAELPGVAEMIPDIARMTGTQAVIAPIDSQSWLPFGLARQLGEWLERAGVACITPMPFCSLTETHIHVLRQRTTYDHALIREFARVFGQPSFRLKIERESAQIKHMEVVRDACCGCARYVATKMVRIPLADALERAGLFHHHYPCQASMGIDPLYGDTLMHISGNIMKDAIKEALGEDLPVSYIRPGGFIEETDPHSTTSDRAS